MVLTRNNHSRISAYMQTTEYLKAISDETRLRAFRAVVEARLGLCVAEMADILQKPQYAISRSFIELRKAGLVTEERQGKFVFYRMATDPAVVELGEWALRHCLCEDLAPKNPDGSTTPGGQTCDYDSERLRWRLGLRLNQKIVTHPQERTEDTRPRMLFVCVHNSARSQLAEEYLRLLAGDRFFVESAGLTAGELNPYVVAHLAAVGINIAQKPTQAVTELYRRGRTYDWVVTVCSREAEENCPVFPGPVRRLSWPFPDPAGFNGSPEQLRAQISDLAAAIKTQVQEFIAKTE